MRETSAGLVNGARASVLPQQTDADPAALRESTETKPLFAVNVRQHKGEILPHLIVRNPGSKENTHRLTKGQNQANLRLQRFCKLSSFSLKKKEKKSVPAVSEINPFFLKKKVPKS